MTKPMDSKQITQFRARIKKASTSFGVMSDMLLMLDIDAMSQADRLTLQQGLQSGKNGPVSYKYLNEVIQRGQK